MTTTTGRAAPPPMTWGGYIWLIVGHSPRGLGVVIGALWRFARDERRAARIDDMVGTGHAKQIDEEERHQRAMKLRAALVLGPPLIGGLVVSQGLPGPLLWPLWAWPALVVGLAVTLGVLGILGLRAVDMPITPAVITIRDGEPPIKQDLIVDALAACGVQRIAKAITDDGYRAIRFMTPIAKDGDGVGVTLELPIGSSVGDIVGGDGDKVLRNFAGGLGRGIERVHIERGKTERELVLYVADSAMGDRGSIEWPLAPTPGQIKLCNIFEPITVGIDLRGKPSTLRAYTSLGGTYATLAGMTGSGKTNTAIIIVAAGCLDPRAELRIYDFKGSPEFEEIGEKVAHIYQVGARTSDLEALDNDLSHLVNVELPRRYDAKRAARKASPDMPAEYGEHYASRKDWGLWPLMYIIDETVPFSIDRENKTEKKLKERIRHNVIQAASLGRSVGLHMIVSGQSMNDDRVPKGYRDNAGLRIGMAARSASTANSYLGDGSVGAGYRCDRLKLPDDMGVGYVEGDGAGTTLTKFANLSDPTLRAAIAEAGRQARLKIGRLTGMAAGEIDPDEELPDVLDHTIVVWPDGSEILAQSELLELLANQFRGEYRQFLDTGDDVALGKMLRAAGVAMDHNGRPVQVTAGPLKGRKAVRFADVLEAMAVRDANRGLSSDDDELSTVDVHLLSVDKPDSGDELSSSRFG